MEGSKMLNILRVVFYYYKKNFKSISLLVLCFYLVFFVYFKLFVINSDFDTEFNSVSNDRLFEGVEVEVKSNNFREKGIFGKFYGVRVSNNSVERVEEKDEYQGGGSEDESKSNDNKVKNIFKKKEINKIKFSDFVKEKILKKKKEGGNKSEFNDFEDQKKIQKKKEDKIFKKDKGENKSEFNDFEDKNIIKLKKEDKEEKINENKYIVSNSKCRLLDQNPWDESIKKYIEPREFESCASTNLLLTSISRGIDGNFSIVINEEIANEYYNDLINCCWSSIAPIKVKKSTVNNNIEFNVSECQDFKDQVQIPAGVELVKVVCRPFENLNKKIFTADYQNIHVVLNSTEFKSRFGDDTLNDKNENKKISVLMLGIESLSRLNFIRSFPKTEKFLKNTGWTSLEGYNKIGESSSSNIMAVLSGLNASSSSIFYKSERQRYLDDFPFIWKDFKQAGYVTAFGEDIGNSYTFNFEQTGFVDPPTDYYPRPYIVATEKFLKQKNKKNNKYCTGPELSFERILNYALDFAVTFLGKPYFGFFWSNSVTHSDINAASSLDSHLLEKLESLEQHGVFNNTLVILFSDQGMHWGGIRNTSVGWYEERLPFVYLRVPETFKNLNNNYKYNTLDIIQALKINERRLTSPYDLHETLRDILERAGGKSSYKSDCSTCQSLFKFVPYERGCEDVGVLPHWCACSEFTPHSSESKMAIKGAQNFLSYVEEIVKDYEDEDGRLCAKLELKKINRFDEIRLKNNNTGIRKFFYQIEVTPGNAVYEVTMDLDENKNFQVSEHEISRINYYKHVADCISDISHKKYCYCSNLLQLNNVK